MRAVVVVGHQPNSPGAKNENFDMSEYEFNHGFAQELVKNFSEHNLSDEIVVAYRRTNYTELPKQVNELNPDLIVSLHCNAFNKEANGCEMLYYHKSEKSKEIARIFQNKLVDALDNKDRGIKPKDSEDRGGHLLKNTKAPCIICEPFFIDNDDEYANVIDNGENLVTAYCEAINESMKYLRQ